MKRVVRPPEPVELTAFRTANPYGTWGQATDEYVNKPVFKALAEAQGWICAYCEQRIGTGAAGRVEHVLPKSGSTPANNRHLAFDNLLACCPGVTDVASEPPPKLVHHCDDPKGDTDPSGQMLDPSRDVPPTPCLWTIDARGRLGVDVENCAHARIDPDLALRTLIFLHLDKIDPRQEEVYEALQDQQIELMDEMSDDAIEAARVRVAQRNLVRAPDGTLAPFWSTIRAWAGPGIEPFLAEHTHEIPGMSK